MTKYVDQEWIIQKVSWSNNQRGYIKGWMEYLKDIYHGLNIANLEIERNGEEELKNTEKIGQQEKRHEYRNVCWNEYYNNKIAENGLKRKTGGKREYLKIGN